VAQEGDDGPYADREGGAQQVFAADRGRVERVGERGEADDRDDVDERTGAVVGAGGDDDEDEQRWKMLARPPESAISSAIITVPSVPTTRNQFGWKRRQGK
jgi:hypothetical protein